MKKTLRTTLNVFIAIISFGQTAEELNKQSKSFLENHDFKNAVPLFRQAAEKGSAEAQYNLDFSYQQGIEVPKSDSVANGCFFKQQYKVIKMRNLKLPTVMPLAEDCCKTILRHFIGR